MPHGGGRPSINYLVAAGTEQSRMRTSTPAVPSAPKSLVQRLYLHDRCSVVVADPERGRSRGVIHLHAPDIRAARHQVFNRLARPGIDAHHAIVRHAARPDFAVLVYHR